MKIGILKEVKDQEYRVAATPDMVKKLSDEGHALIIEKNAGLGSGFTNENYEASGASISDHTQALYDDADLLLKVKEPIPSEYGFFRENQTIMTYFHLAAHPKLATFLCDKHITSIAYEAIKTENHHYPLLAPMSEIAGRLSIFEGAKYLQKSSGGSGKLLCGTTTVDPAKVLVIGAGSVGLEAAKLAYQCGAEVTLLDISSEKITWCQKNLPQKINCIEITPEILSQELAQSDLVIGAVLSPGKRAPIVITHKHLKLMKTGSVIVDVAIDQGGCCESSRPTTHHDPIFEFEGIIHYCVSNMPGSVPLTGTMALCEASFPYILEIANKGISSTLSTDSPIRDGVLTYHGKIYHSDVATSLSLPCQTWD